MLTVLMQALAWGDEKYDLAIPVILGPHFSQVGIGSLGSRKLDSQPSKI